MPIQADLYTHLTEVFNRIMLHHPNDAYDKFEDISSLVKKTNFKIKDPSFDGEVNERAAVITHQDALNAIQKWKNLVQSIKIKPMAQLTTQIDSQGKNYLN